MSKPKFWCIALIARTVFQGLVAVGAFFLLCGCQAQGVGGPDEVMDYRTNRHADYILRDSLHRLPDDSTDWDTMVVTADTVDSMLDRTFRIVEGMNVDMMFCLYEIVVARTPGVIDTMMLIDSILDDWETRGLITKEVTDETD